MQTSLALTALLMGLAGGPHCVAMCGAACAGIAQTGRWSLLLFQAGRLLGYGTLGALAAASVQGLGWLTVQSAALRPVWTLFHVAVALLGLSLMLRARQPVWIDWAGRKVWAMAKRRAVAGGLSTVVLGALWALLPCGLLYSALLVAALGSRIVDGALAMVLFGLGSGVALWVGSTLWLRLQTSGLGSWSMRLAGLALCISSSWALWLGLFRNTAPWCTTT